MSKKNYAVITLWDRACKLHSRIPNPRIGEQMYQKATFFERKDEAMRWFEKADQGQDEIGGEVDRFLVKVLKRFR